MNNSKIAFESIPSPVEIDRKPWLQKREGELVRTIEAIKEVRNTDAWSSLKNEVFDGVVEKLEKDLLAEAKKDSPDNLSLARLNGQLVWAKKFADLDQLANIFRLELANIRKFLYGSQETTGARDKPIGSKYL